MPLTPADLTPAALAFLTEHHLATLSSVRSDGTPHVVPVGFTWDGEAGLARVITGRASVKARLAERGGPVALSSVDGARWLTMEGDTRLSREPDRVADAVARYAARYRQPRENPERAVIEVTVHRILLSAALR